MLQLYPLTSTANAGQILYIYTLAFSIISLYWNGTRDWIASFPANVWIRIDLTTWRSRGAYMYQYIRTSLVQITFALSHYRSQCWFPVNWTLDNKFQWESNHNEQFHTKNKFYIVVFKMLGILSQYQCVKLMPLIVFQMFGPNSFIGYWEVSSDLSCPPGFCFSERPT